ncbi:MAG: CBS domain-containing protein [Candidatus Dadabacteria bacterium]|nr:MAG: CBS domain-containing protein [Candidatus Dadabacteria bacterium]
MKVSDICKLKRMRLQTISPEHTVQEATRKLVEFNIGALPVCNDDGDLVGIISERDILRLAASDDCHKVASMKVGAVMTRNLIIAVPSDRVDSVMHVMTERRIRHLPILEGRRLIDIISIGDVVKAKLDESDTEIRFLRDYVAG